MQVFDIPTIPITLKDIQTSVELNEDVFIIDVPVTSDIPDNLRGAERTQLRFYTITSETLEYENSDDTADIVRGLLDDVHALLGEECGRKGTKGIFLHGGAVKIKTEKSEGKISTSVFLSYADIPVWAGGPLGVASSLGKDVEMFSKVVQTFRDSIHAVSA